jgi:hypothetical protein
VTRSSARLRPALARGAGGAEIVARLRPPAPRLVAGLCGVGLGLAGLALCCSPAASPRPLAPLRLTHVRPERPEGLFLNEEIVFYFDQELDPASVTGGSVEILSEPGRAPALGELRVENDHVRFVPAPVLAPDLSDGGYLPDTRYRATLSGFPRADGIRGMHGALLEHTVTFDFRTVRVDHPRTGILFEDRMQNRSGLLRLFPSTAGQGGLIRGQDSIYLACDKPIDPSTVTPDAFQLRLMDDRLRGRPSRPRGFLPTLVHWAFEMSETVAVRVRVLENDSGLHRLPRPPGLRSSAPADVWEREPRACLVELTPVTRLAAGLWELRPVPEAEGSEPRLRDFGGRPVVFAGSSATLRIDPSAESGGREFREEFESRRYSSPVAVPGYDGTAYWGDSGRVEVRYPAAAGSGADGDVVLGTTETRADVQATSLDLAKDVECQLNARPGLVVLRCQGRMSIRGRLTRRAPWDAARETERDPALVEWARLRDKSAVGAETLSTWLRKERAIEGNWTVLVAGGDLEISGVLSTTTPLLLVAGGRIRVPGKVEWKVDEASRKVTLPAAPPGSDESSSEKPAEVAVVGGVFLLREGGGLDIEPTPSPAPVVLDEPQGENPLKKKLRFAALSGPIPQRGGVLRWLPPESGGSPESPSGAWRIRFVPDLASTPKGATDPHPVESPALLDPPGPVKFLVELEVEPAGPRTRAWSPPWVDYVHLSWEQPQAEAGQDRGDR